jgi:hypothetical protein
MDRTFPATPRLAALLLILVLGLILAACGAESAGAPGVDQRDAGGEEPAASPAGEDTDGGPGSELDPDDGAPPLAAPIEQRIVKTGEVTLEVENVGEALGRVRAMAVELGGYVGGSQAGTLEDRATLTIRIPAATFEDALARLHGMDAEVIAEATREQDVTSQVVDLGARIENLGASEASYRELVARAERVEDILAVQSRLDDVRGQIEQLQAQLDALEGQAALSTLTVTLVPRPTPVTTTTEAWDPAAQLDRALASLVGIGQGLLDGLIWFVVVWLPILLVLALLGLIALRGVLEVRRRMPVAATTTSDEGAA